LTPEMVELDAMVELAPGMPILPAALYLADLADLVVPS